MHGFVQVTQNKNFIVPLFIIQYYTLSNNKGTMATSKMRQWKCSCVAFNNLNKKLKFQL